MTKLDVKCECEGTGYIAVVDQQGEDTNYVECAAHNPAYENAFDQQLAFNGKTVMEHFGEIEAQAAALQDLLDNK